MRDIEVDCIPKMKDQVIQSKPRLLSMSTDTSEDKLKSKDGCIIF